MVLTNYDHDPLLDLDPWVGQRQATYRFALTNAVTGEILGDIHPIKSATLSHDSSRTTSRTLSMKLGVADQAAVNTVQDRVSVYMTFPDGTEYPLGRYMWTDNTRQEFTSGDLGSPVLNDEMFLVDQAITTGINGVGKALYKVIQLTLEGLPITYTVQWSGDISTEAWGIGQYRGSILQSLAITGDYFNPWFDNTGVLRFIRTFNPSNEIPDFDWDEGNQVMRANVVKNDDLLTAPNTFIVISNAAESTNGEVVGRATVPDSAPHSRVNRGFEIVEVRDLQLSNAAQAQQVAQGLVNRQTLFERASVSTAPDPRFDSYNVIHWQGAKWLSLAWQLVLTEGAPMNHMIRRAYQD
jgi:hypothetical protein